MHLASGGYNEGARGGNEQSEDPFRDLEEACKEAGGRGEGEVIIITALLLFMTDR